MQIRIALLTAALVLAPTMASARETMHKLSIQDALNGQYKDKAALATDIQLFFGSQKPTGKIETIREISTSRKTNAVGKSDAEACQWALFSALKALQDEARGMGGKAVVNIVSNYKHQAFESDSEFECGAGAIMAGVALKGTVIK
jgi:uncharacterized protein YbjQ (UPF0145 family)